MNEPINIEEWTVHRSRHDLRHVAVIFDGSPSPAPWLAKLRRLLPELFSKHAPTDLLHEVRRSGRIDLGTLDCRVAWGIGAKLREQGYEVASEDASTVGHLPVRTVGGEQLALIIEDDEEAEAFARDLIARGAAVVESER